MTMTKNVAAINFRYEMDLLRLIEQFPDEHTCRRYREALRWPDGAICPRCGSGEHVTDLRGGEAGMHPL